MTCSLFSVTEIELLKQCIVRIEWGIVLIIRMLSKYRPEGANVKVPVNFDPQVVEVLVVLKADNTALFVQYCLHPATYCHLATNISALKS